ncbi:hypothetical protein E3P77_02289 [Wallemia ichthyophaga]|uniref:Fumarylacetoacetate hydrolase domain-containing protein 2-like protein n=1 Tax=Wallemia ichthyophaga (strain EXF-994 / CBS 113033) TaxID=1299270 RepID=R9AAL6_WALI9|nr:Fumarylacetoacetate hydrolase domain-containing protein 2-like protein [Wallemia ichthyophaga EXF-994]TIB10315.1 hypothetical protein E3P93_02895 [Wallemia ichthyophaga]EOQ99226.1 Fumarylacetoacetate hydrolase domain-containing protein 2-like protein [Wallemia ichthyophaga EXF-994]TIB22643.1 hypothetical protein E3P88_02907 [Wallemia ichthyophaga]TIB45840.1 hypothetical protein E3P82_02534 [Wallemia ichthyophaga]TIB66440.1 hypothetical protein E3P77_02289 [Wallemia ichthyophaga]
MSKSAIRQWNRLIRFTAKEDGRIYIGEPLLSNIDVGTESHIQAETLDTRSALTATRHTGEVKTVSQLLSPIASNEVVTSRFLGLNYRDHAEECGMQLPKAPILFYKPSTALSGPNDVIPIPRVSQPSSKFKVDYEAEFVAVIGTPAKNVTVGDALNHVLGYSLGNDVSVRRHQGATSQWGFSKSFDGSAPWGPCLVSAQSIDADNVHLGARVNGNVLQNGSTSKQIFSLAETIAFLSQGTTLEPGSLLWTGTPAGVGFSRTPPITLNEDDTVDIFSNTLRATLTNSIKND